MHGGDHLRAATTPSCSILSAVQGCVLPSKRTSPSIVQPQANIINPAAFLCCCLPATIRAIAVTLFLHLMAKVAAFAKASSLRTLVGARTSTHRCLSEENRTGCHKLSELYRPRLSTNS